MEGVSGAHRGGIVWHRLCLIVYTYEILVSTEKIKEENQEIIYRAEVHYFKCT